MHDEVEEPVTRHSYGKDTRPQPVSPDPEVEDGEKCGPDQSAQQAVRNRVVVEVEWRDEGGVDVNADVFDASKDEDRPDEIE